MRQVPPPSRPDPQHDPQLDPRLDPGPQPAPFSARLDELTERVAAYRHGRVPAELRRCHIIAVALALFAERGYRDASMDELATRAGVSKPVIYGLVGDKERLFLTCVDAVTAELAERVRTAMRAHRRPEPGLRAGIRAFFTFVADAGDGWDRLSGYEGGPLAVAVSAARRRQAEVVAELLGELLAGAGNPVAPERVEAVAHAVNGACESLAAWWRRHPDTGPDELVDLATGLLLPGVLQVGGPGSGARSASEPEAGPGGSLTAPSSSGTVDLTDGSGITADRSGGTRR